MVRNTEEHAARLDAHTLNRAALQNDAVARCRPFDGGRHVAGLLNRRNRGFRHIEVYQPLPGIPGRTILSAAGGLES